MKNIILKVVLFLLISFFNQLAVAENFHCKQ